MTALPSAQLTADLRLRLLVPGGDGIPVDATLTFDTTDPFAITVSFRTGIEESVEWTFARQLLTDGMSRAAGFGDVRVWPAESAEGAQSARLVFLALSSPSGSALFELPGAELLAFLTRTYAVVAPGGETGHVDLDAELALLLWSGVED